MATGENGRLWKGTGAEGLPGGAVLPRRKRLVGMAHVGGFAKAASLGSPRCDHSALTTPATPTISELALQAAGCLEAGDLGAGDLADFARVPAARVDGRALALVAPGGG